MPTLGDRLKELIRDAELAGKRAVKTELAKACGVKKASVSGWLSGDSKSMRPDNLVAAADFFHVPIRWLAVGKGPKRLNGDTPPARDTAAIDAIRFAPEERQAIARHIRARLHHHGMATADLIDLMKISSADAAYITEHGTENLPALKRLLDALPHSNGRRESMDFIVWGLSRFAIPMEGPHAEHIEAARQRTRKVTTR